MSELTTELYRLRAAGPMPVGSAGAGSYVVHTFMAESSTVTANTCTSIDVGSESFRGQGGNLTSATYNRLPIKGSYYSASLVSDITYIEERT